MPLVGSDIVVLAAIQLALVVAVIPAERIDHALVVHSWEESLLLWHLSFNFQFALGVGKIRVSVTLPTHQEPSVCLVYVNHRQEGRKGIPVNTPRAPLEAHRGVLRVHARLIEFVIRVLQEHLVSPCKLQLLNLQRHPADPFASMFEP